MPTWTHIWTAAGHRQFPGYVLGSVGFARWSQARSATYMVMNRTPACTSASALGGGWDDWSMRKLATAALPSCMQDAQ
jgi:hypothetical protein